MKSSEILQKTRDLLSDPSHWIKGDLARDDSQSWTNPNHPEAVCWCSWGAVSKVRVDLKDEAKQLGILLEGFKEVPTLRFRSGVYPTIPSMNDHPDTTHAEILQGFDNAIRIAKERGD